MKQNLLSIAPHLSEREIYCVIYAYRRFEIPGVIQDADLSVRQTNKKWMWYDLEEVIRRFENEIRYYSRQEDTVGSSIYRELSVEVWRLKNKLQDFLNSAQKVTPESRI